MPGVLVHSCGKKSARTSHSESKRKNYLLTRRTEPVTTTSESSRDYTVGPRFKRNAVKIKASRLAETLVLDAISHPAGEPRCKISFFCKLAQQELYFPRCYEQTHFGVKFSGSFIIDLNVLTQGISDEEEEEMLKAKQEEDEEETDQDLLSAEEEEVDLDCLENI